MKLTDRTVLITGGGQGIGGGLARAFHERGNKVIITGRNPSTLKTFAASFPGMELYPMDVSKDGDIRRMFTFISKKYPRLDVLINNAGIWQNQNFTQPETLKTHLFDEIEINFKGLIRMTQVFLPLLFKQENSSLINISSGLAYMPLSIAPVYCATKAAVHSFSMSLRHQLRQTSVHVIEIAPPAVETNLGKIPGQKEQIEYPKLELDPFIQKTMKALASRKTELPIGQSKMLRLGSRFSPGIFFSLLNPAQRPFSRSQLNKK